LPIRAQLASRFDTFIPRQAHPSKIFEDRLLRLLGRPLDVGVFDAKNERAVLAACGKPVEQCGARVADVQVAGR
jgi:hypothetical protein